jgi:hypothetical protein
VEHQQTRFSAHAGLLQALQVNAQAHIPNARVVELSIATLLPSTLLLETLLPSQCCVLTSLHAHTTHWRGSHASDACITQSLNHVCQAPRANNCLRDSAAARG